MAKAHFAAAACLDQARKKTAQVIGMVVNMRRFVGVGGDMNGAHTHGMRRGKIALFILEHGGGFGQHTVARENGSKGLGIGFGAKVGMLDAVNRIKHPA